MNNLQQAAQPVSAVICPLSPDDENDARQAAERLSAAGVKVYFIANADRDPAAALRLAVKTQSEHDSVCVFVYCASELPKTRGAILQCSIPVGRYAYLCLPDGNGGRAVHKLETEGAVPVSGDCDPVSLVWGQIPASPVRQETECIPTVSDNNIRKHIIIAVCAALVCLLALIPIAQCARGCYLFGGPLYIDHEYIDTSPYSPAEEEESPYSGVISSLFDTPSANMYGDDLDELLEIRAEGDYTYCQYIGGDVKGQVHIEKYTGGDKNVTMPETLGGMKIVGTGSAFKGNASVVSVTIPDGYTRIDTEAFLNCSSLKRVSIPDSVTEIEPRAFYGCTSLESIELPDCLSELTQGVFYGCSALKSIKLPESLVKIDESAFHDCVSLRELVIPDSVTEIGELMCRGCDALERVTLGDGLAEIPDYAFQGCPSLSGVSFGKSIKKIGAQSFEKAGIKSITIPEGITDIGSNAFKSCDSLKSVVLPSSLETIDVNPFKYCSSLERIKVNGKGDGFCDIDGVLFASSGESLVCFPAGRSGSYTVPEGTGVICDYAFFFSALEKVELPESLYQINDSAFYGSGIKEIELPDRVYLLGKQAFGACKELAALRIGAGLGEIGDKCFENCPALAEITVPPDNKSFYTEQGMLILREPREIIAALNGVEGDLVIPEGITAIRSSVFRNNEKITSVTFPKGFETVGSHAFSGCSSISEINFGGTEKELGTNAFNGCVLLESIDLPDSIVTLGQGSFRDCAALTDIRIGNNTETMDFAFDGCSSLETVSIPGSVVSMRGAFRSCASLRYIMIPDSVTDLSNAFEGCTSLEYAALGRGVEKTDISTFKECTALKALYIPAKQEFHTGRIKDCTSLEKIYYGGTERQWDMNLVREYLLPFIPDSVEMVYGCEVPPEPGDVISSSDAR